MTPDQDNPERVGEATKALIKLAAPRTWSDEWCKEYNMYQTLSHANGVVPLSTENWDCAAWLGSAERVKWFAKFVSDDVHSTAPAPSTVPASPRDELSYQQRKDLPIVEGLIDYFPDACLYVSHVSFVANEQHNPGETMHWAREKSIGRGNEIVRHMIDRGKIDTDKLRHSGKLAWRSMELLQREIEADRARGIDMFGNKENQHECNVKG